MAPRRLAWTRLCCVTHRVPKDAQHIVGMTTSASPENVDAIPDCDRPSVLRCAADTAGLSREKSHDDLVSHLLPSRHADHVHCARMLQCGPGHGSIHVDRALSTER
jgi:hypothetical protein